MLSRWRLIRRSRRISDGDDLICDAVSAPKITLNDCLDEYDNHYVGNVTYTKMDV